MYVLDIKIVVFLAIGLDFRNDVVFHTNLGIDSHDFDRLPRFKETVYCILRGFNTGIVQDEQVAGRLERRGYIVSRERVSAGYIGGAITHAKPLQSNYISQQIGATRSKKAGVHDH